MAGERTIRVQILGDARGATRAMADTEASAGSLLARFDGLGVGIAGLGVKLGALAGGFLALQGFQALGGALRGLVGDAQESARVGAQLDAVLKSTGGAAGLTADDINDLTDSLSALTGVDDEAITSAQSVLLTFTNIGKRVFPEATAAILDLSAALGQDLQSSTVQIGKALNDPIAGISALSRVGVSFTADQKKLIEALVESGDVLGAQKIILAELNKEFGGSAAAQATNVKRLQVAWGNFREELGGKLLPIVEKVAGALNGWLRSDRAQQGIARLTRGIEGLVGTVTQVYTILARRDFTGGGWLSEDGPIAGGIFKMRDAVTRRIIPALQLLWRTFSGGGGAVGGFASATGTVMGVLAKLGRFFSIGNR